MKIESGKPENMTGRLSKEVRVYELLDRLGIAFDRVDHEAAMTMEACAEIDEALSPACVCKNLLLTNTQRTAFYLLMMPGEKKFKTKELSGQINTARLSFAEGEYMEKYLDITPGSLSVLGLMNDTDGNVRLLIDADILKEEYICAHPCINTSTLRLKTNDLTEKILPAVGHGYTVVELSKDA